MILFFQYDYKDTKRKYFEDKTFIFIYKGCPKINARFELNIKESFQSLDIYFLNE